MTTPGKHKKFNKQLYEEYNDKAIASVLAHIESSSGMYARINPNKFGPDIILYRGYKPYSYIEVEVVSRWTNGDFPYANVHILGRKAKYLKLGLPIEFWRLRADTQVCIIVPDYVIEKDMLQEVPNSMMPEGEQMFCVPLDLCITKELNNV